MKNQAEMNAMLDNFKKFNRKVKFLLMEIDKNIDKNTYFRKGE